jgi:cyanobactin biosynthesis protein (PatB/AcyB/McaB family)
MGRYLKPPQIKPVQRLGGPFWPDKRPVVIVNPADLVDLEHGTSAQLFDLQWQQIHGANVNDPAKWRVRSAAQGSAACPSGLGSCLGMLFRGS